MRSDAWYPSWQDEDTAKNRSGCSAQTATYNKKEKEAQRQWYKSFETLKPYLRNTHSLIMPHLLILPKQSHQLRTKYWNIWAYMSLSHSKNKGFVRYTIQHAIICIYLSFIFDQIKLNFLNVINEQCFLWSLLVLMNILIPWMCIVNIF